VLRVECSDQSGHRAAPRACTGGVAVWLVGGAHTADEGAAQLRNATSVALSPGLRVLRRGPSVAPVSDNADVRCRLTAHPCWSASSRLILL